MQQFRRLGLLGALVASLVVGSPTAAGATGVDARLANPTAVSALQAPQPGDGPVLAILAAPHPAPSRTELTLLDLTNAERAGHGLGPLELDPLLLGIARVRAAAQLTDGPLSHDDGNGGLAFAGLLAESEIDYRLAGENLARWVTDDQAGLERVQRAWMASPSHRNNILDPAFNRLAVGAATDGSGRVAFAQIFRATP